jgi:hypothetical protein
VCLCAWGSNGVQIVVSMYRCEFDAASLPDIKVSVCREETGLESEADAIRHLENTMPREQVLDGTRRMRSFIEKFREHMDQQLSSRGASDHSEFVVTKEFVEEFVSGLRREESS